MKLIRKVGKEFTKQDGTKGNYINLYLEFETGARVLIRAVNSKDTNVLSAFSTKED